MIRVMTRWGRWGRRFGRTQPYCRDGCPTMMSQYLIPPLARQHPKMHAASAKMAHSSHDSTSIPLQLFAVRQVLSIFSNLSSLIFAVLSRGDAETKPTRAQGVDEPSILVCSELRV